MAVPAKSICDRVVNVVVEEELHSAGSDTCATASRSISALWSSYVCEALVDLSAREIGERSSDRFHVVAEQVIGDDIMDADAGALDAGVSPAYAGRADDVAVRCGYVVHWFRV